MAKATIGILVVLSLKLANTLVEDSFRPDAKVDVREGEKAPGDPPSTCE